MAKNHLEDDHQRALFKWASFKPELETMYHVPNGGQRRQKEAARLSGLGVKPGVPDVCLPLARCGYHSLYIEMKAPIVKGKPKPRVTSTQIAYLKQLKEQGHAAVVCYGWLAAKRIIELYLMDHPMSFDQQLDNSSGKA